MWQSKAIWGVALFMLVSLYSLWSGDASTEIEGIKVLALSLAGLGMRDALNKK